jgi:hypothetical protein
VSQAAPEPESPHSVRIAGTEAEAENQSDMASSSAPASNASARQRPGEDSACAASGERAKAREDKAEPAMLAGRT